MNLLVSDSIAVADFRPGDQAALTEHLQVRQIYEQTLNIPFPYTTQEADAWVNMTLENTKRLGFSVQWTIRDRKSDQLIGGVGLAGDFSKQIPHRAEIGYWLAKPYWGQGIMTQVVSRVSEESFRVFPSILKLTAHVFAFNIGSARVLEKSGYHLEAPLLRAHYLKDGKIWDGRMFARFSPQFLNEHSSPSST